MNLARPGLAQHADDFSRGRAAHDRVVDQNDPLSRHHLSNGIELDLDPKMADRLLGLDEGPPDVVVSHQPECKREPRLARVAQGRIHARVGHRHDHVRRGGVFPRQARPESLARGRHALSEDERIGTREVDMFEDARGESGKRETLRGETLARQPDDLSRLDVALVARLDQVERACLRRHHRRALSDPKRKRPDAVGVARREDPLPGEDEQRVRPAHLGKRLGDRADECGCLGASDQVEDDLRVRRGREESPGLFEAFPDLPGVDEVSVVRERQRAAPRGKDDRLCVDQERGASRRVPDMPDRGPPG